MAMSRVQGYAPAILITGLLIVSLVTGSAAVSPGPGASRSRKPEIRLGLPYSQKKGVIALSEDTPLHSLLAYAEVVWKDNMSAVELDCVTHNRYVGLSFAFVNALKIELVNYLDREAHPEFNVSIVCTEKKDVPTVTATAGFVLEVKDVNDNEPTFSTPEMAFEVPEGLPIGTSVAAVSAYDPDADRNGEVHYSFDSDYPSTDAFIIDENTGQILTNQELDREEIAEYNITVVATDSGQPALSGTAILIFKVKDENDNAPIVITKSLHIKENQKPATLVGTLLAQDIDEGKNAEVVFSKVEDSDSSSNSPFLVQSNGAILSVASLDREQKSEYSMLVSVRDKGSPRQSSTATVFIVVDDVNDHPPVIAAPCLEDEDDYFLMSDSVSNSSDSAATSNTSNRFLTITWHRPDDRQVVFHVKASDNDQGDNSRISYAIQTETTDYQLNSSVFTVTKDKDRLFKVNKTSGEITLRRHVRRNDNHLQILNISATDHGHPSLTTYCSIGVILDLDSSKLSPRANQKTEEWTNVGNSAPPSATGAFGLACLVWLLVVCIGGIGRFHSCTAVISKL